MVRPTVIALDDDPLVQDLLRDVLDEAGFNVVLADTAAEAIAAVEREQSNGLVGLVTDVNLGTPATGWDVAARARELCPALPVVYVTGDSEHEWASRGVPQSVMVTKPFAPAQIVVALAGLANRADPAA